MSTTGTSRGHRTCCRPRSRLASVSVPEKSFSPVGYQDVVINGSVEKRPQGRQPVPAGASG